MGKNLVAKKKNQEVGNYTGGVNPFLAAANSEGALGGGFLGFSGKTGRFTTGQDKEEVQIGTQFAVNMSEYKLGWICWVNNSKQDEHLVAVISGELPPQKHELTDYGPYGKGDGWTEQASIQFKDLEEGKELTFNTSSKSGRRALGKLALEYGQKMKMNLDDEGNPMVPIVELGVGSWEMADPETGRKVTNYFPTFVVVDWMSHAELLAMSGEDIEDESDYGSEFDDDDDVDEDEDEDDDVEILEDDGPWEDDEDDDDVVEEDPKPARRTSAKKASASKKRTTRSRKF